MSSWEEWNARSALNFTVFGTYILLREPCKCQRCDDLEVSNLFLLFLFLCVCEKLPKNKREQERVIWSLALLIDAALNVMVCQAIIVSDHMCAFRSLCVTFSVAFFLQFGQKQVDIKWKVTYMFRFLQHLYWSHFEASPHQQTFPLVTHTHCVGCLSWLCSVVITQSRTIPVNSPHLWYLFVCLWKGAGNIFQLHPHQINLDQL